MSEPAVGVDTVAKPRVRVIPQAVLTLAAFGALALVSWLTSLRLGEALGVSDVGVLTWVDLSLQAYGTYPAQVTDALTRLAAGFGLTLAGYVTGRLLLRRRSRPASDLHGSARWADKKEIVESGLLPRSGLLARLFPRKESHGVFVGGWMDRGQLRYLRHDGPEHVLVMAPTRSGKGVGLVLPTLLDWRESALVHDPKGECWAITSGWRRMIGHKVIRFDPTLPFPEAARFNPLNEIRIKTTSEVADAQNLATIIADPEGAKEEGDHWTKTSRAFLTGVLLHACYVADKEPDRPATLSRIVAMLSDPERPADELLNEMLVYPHLENGETHQAIAQQARAMSDRDSRERSSIWSTAISYLELYADPMVAEATSESDFKVADLMHHDQPVTLYLVVRPSDADRLRPLIRMILTQIIRLQTRDMHFEGGRATAHYKHRLLFMVDEFPSLNRLPLVEKALPYVAGYGLRFYLVTQDANQLTQAYDRDESITSNCHIRVAFAPNRLETADMLSRLAGDQTVIHQQISASGGAGDLALDHVSQSVSEVRRALLTPDEIMRLPGARKARNGDIESGGDMLVFVAGHRPVYGRQILYFKDPVLSERAMVPPPRMSDRIRHND